MNLILEMRPHSTAFMSVVRSSVQKDVVVAMVVMGSRVDPTLGARGDETEDDCVDVSPLASSTGAEIRFNKTVFTPLPSLSYTPASQSRDGDQCTTALHRCNNSASLKDLTTKMRGFKTLPYVSMRAQTLPTEASDPPPMSMKMISSFKKST